MNEPIPNLVLFDGVCGLCDRSVQFLLRIDRRQRLHFAPLQGETSATILRRYSLDDLGGDFKSLVLVRGFGTPEERVFLRSAGALRILAAAGGIWRAAAALLLVPRPLRDWIYDWVARNRYRWFGKFDSCRRPEPGVAQRFLP